MKGQRMFEGKTIWITGASSGIGKALARAFGKVGAQLVLSGRREDALSALADEIGSEKCLVLPFETTDYEALAERVQDAVGFTGAIDGLINNAGISQRSLAVDTDFAVYRRIVEVDLLAPIALTQALLPHLLEREASWIVNISSVAGKVGVPMRTAYCAAKHGLVGYGDALRAECAQHGLHLLTVAPGSVRTDVSRNALAGDGSRRGVSDKAIDQGLEPSAVAQRILEALNKGEREIVIADGMEAGLPGMRAESPDQVFDLMDRMVREGYARRMDAR
ncbi:SDR family NAD(P)-dependent oxidoreductase [Novosphingopyxis iocasae]|uniref:SDR family NAD(P)-dependent oxidoreductase n=1 Tax=Novosphingopyxis iocasae TaxID=2762729 RepID=UPI001FE4CD97|nr:SDR family NAD(P)-dependent oxidoreductase [Novosphingopyxis iocasae]